jgi:hypothetical protein
MSSSQMKSFSIRASMCILHASASKNVRSHDLNVYGAQIRYRSRGKSLTAASVASGSRDKQLKT